MAREKVDNKLNVVIGTKAQIVGDTTIPENSIIITTDEIGSGGGYEPDGVTIVLNNSNELEVSKDLEVEWTKVVNKPTFSTVATTGSYNDLSGKPDLTKKLDKDFSALPNQASPLLTDVLAINRGTVAQKTTLGNLLAQVDAEIFVVVVSLPTTGVVNKIYLLPKGTPESQDGYDEFIWVNNAWELIGSVKLDLSNYYNKTEANGLLSAKADKDYVDSQRAEDEISNKGYTDREIAKLETETEDKLANSEIANRRYVNPAFKDAEVAKDTINGTYTFTFTKLDNTTKEVQIDTPEESIIEVTKLPSIWKGTPIPNEGHVDKIYFNTNISTNKVIDIISKLTYIREDPEKIGVYYIIEAENASESLIGCYVLNLGDIYSIMDYSQTLIFAYNVPETSDGWQNIKEVPIDENVVSESTFIFPGSVGAENNLLSSIFSVTPFEYLNEVDESKIYKLNDNGVYSYWRYVNDQWIEVINDLRESYINNAINNNTTNIATNKQDITDLRGRLYYSPDEVSLFSFIPSKTSNTFKVGGTDLKVDWGDGETEVINSTITHTYAEPYKRVMVVIEKGTITELGINSRVDFVSLGKNNITDMTNLLYNCRNIRMISYFNTSNTTSTNVLFFGDTELLEVPFMDVSKVTDASSMFNGCSKLVSVPPLNFTNVTDASSMFRGCSNLVSVPLFDTSNVEDLSELFYGCNSLVEVPPLNFTNVTDASYMFRGCSKLVSVPPLNFTNVTDASYMFRGCESLIEVRALSTNGVTSAYGMFKNCSKLVSVPLFDTSNVEDLSELFYGCNSLVEVPRLDAGKASTLVGIFSGCTSLRRIHMINFNARFDITDTALEHDALIEVISNLKPQEGATKTLTMGAEKLALLSAEEKTVATGKGWTLA